MDINRLKEIIAMPKEERQKRIREFLSVEDLKELDKMTEAVKVGEAYNFLFEDKNNEYDEEYQDYIEDGKSEIEYAVEKLKSEGISSDEIKEAIKNMIAENIKQRNSGRNDEK